MAVAGLSARLAGLAVAPPAPRRAPAAPSAPFLRGTALPGAAPRCVAVRAAPFGVFAKQNALQRQRLAEKQRLYNKARKSAVATRCRKVLKALADFKGKAESEEALAPVEAMMSEAFKEVDKAVVKGVVKKNTANRRKSRLSVAKKKLLISSGLYMPAPAS